MRAFEDDARRLATQDITGLRGGQPVGWVGLAAVELADIERAGEARHMGAQPARQRADIEFGLAEARTKVGIIGVKVWIFKGEVLQRKARRIQ